MSEFGGLDRRIHAYDEIGRVAEVALLDRLDGSFTFVEPTPAWNGAGRFALHARPDAGSPQVSEVRPGEALEIVLTRPDGWSWLRTLSDGYLGFGHPARLRRAAPLGGCTVTALRGHVYAAASVQSARIGDIGLGSVLTPVGEQTGSEQAGGWQAGGWQAVAWGDGQGYVANVVTAPLPDPDPASLALRLLGTPYLWGGRSAWGLDCSGLTQLICGAFGQTLPRDSDLQRAALKVIGTPRRGDLAFFPGHVALMLSDRQLVHANSVVMAVSVQTLGEGEYGQALASALLGFGRWEA